MNISVCTPNTADASLVRSPTLQLQQMLECEPHKQSAFVMAIHDALFGMLWIVSSVNDLTPYWKGMLEVTPERHAADAVL